MRILNIDMDYFQNDIFYTIFPGEERPDSCEIKPWSKEKFVEFLENKIELNIKDKIKGKIVKQHHEIFYYLREKILKGDLTTPFDYVHIDAHFDMGVAPDGTWMYIVQEYINKSLEDRYYPEKLNDYYAYSHFGCGNYVLFMLANNWINKVEYWYHPKLDEFDFRNEFVKLVDRDKEVFRVGLDTVQWRMLADKNIFDLGIKPDIETTIQCFNEDSTMECTNYDYIVVSQSPNYTVSECSSQAKL